MSFTAWAKKRLKGEVNPHLTPDLYLKCFPRALSRMSLLLNSQIPIIANGNVSNANSDQEIFRFYESKKLANRLWQLACVRFREDEISRVPFSEGFEATNLFYGRYNISLPTQSNLHVMVKLEIPEKFVDMSYDGLHLPTYQIEQINPKNILGVEFQASCATNYLLRNFWHNYIHEVFHGTTDRTFRNFRGAAREETDFDADNISFLVLARSYGLSVKCDGDITETEREELIRLLRCNRCNTVFRGREEERRPAAAGQSNTDQTYDDFLESEWRERRSLSGYISGWLLVDGLAVTDVRVYFVGNVNKEIEGYKRKTERVVVALNRVHFSFVRLKHFGQPRFRREIATTVANLYRDFIADNGLYRVAAEKYWKVCAERLHIPS